MTFKEKNRSFINVLFVISLVLFLWMIRQYLIALLLAVIFASLLNPTKNWLQSKLKISNNFSSILTTILFLLMIVIPSLFLLVQILNQASELSTTLLPYIQKQLEKGPQSDVSFPDWLPYKDYLEPYREQILSRVNELIGRLGGIIVNGLGSLTSSTVTFFIDLFIMLFALFFYLSNGKQILQKLNYYLPLTEKEFNTIRIELMSTSRATIKGAVVIGLVQGALVGIGMWATGFQGYLFWGAVAAIMSLIPSVGTAIVYIPAAAYLLLTGNTTGGIGLLLWGLLVVGTIDNFLRPVLVGKDTKISELMILVSTLGGITMFGLSGVIIGPMVASFFITMAKIYREDT